jgi:hypothetical protein
MLRLRLRLRFSITPECIDKILPEDKENPPCEYLTNSDVDTG